MMTKYDLMEKVGSGNFSTVHVAKNINTGQIAAIKIMKTHQNIAIREAHFLKSFQHPNIVKLLDFEINPSKGQSKIVIEYLPQNTLQLYQNQQYGLRQQQVKCILFQVSLGLAYIHQKGIIHRDIKPQNILIDKRKAEIKLIDFGLAISADKINTDYVATRWYRAPQNLLGTKEYSSAIDVFSLGCVIIEMYLGNPLFPGTDNIDQLHRIFSLLGQPTQNTWYNGFIQYERLGLRADRKRMDHSNKFGNSENLGIRSLLNSCSPVLVVILQKMLKLNPKQRITSKQIILDNYFKDIKTIIPPHIYKRFQKDHLSKKTIRKQVTPNVEYLINSPKNKTKNSAIKTEPAQIVNPIILPNKVEIGNSPCTLVNFTMTPRAKINREQQKQKQTSLKTNLAQSNSFQIKVYNQNHKQQSQTNTQKYLSFGGVNPIKNNKLSVKDARKNQDINSVDKSSRKQSRNNSMQSAAPLDKIIKSTNNLFNKNTNSNLGSVLPEKKGSDERGKDFRTPQSKLSKSIQRGPALYSFKGQLSKSSKYISPTHLINLNYKHNQPLTESKTQSKSIHIPNSALIISNDTLKIKQESLIINSPNNTNNRINPSQTSIVLPVKQHQKVSRSPSGICLTQVHNTLNTVEENTEQYDKNSKQTLIKQQNNYQTQQKFKSIPYNNNNNNQQPKNSKYFLAAPLNCSNSEIKFKSLTVTQPDQKNLQFKNKLKMIASSKKINPPDSNVQSKRLKTRIEPGQISNKWTSPEGKMKNFKSLQHRDKFEAPRLFQVPPQLLSKDKVYEEDRHKLKPYLTDKNNLGSSKIISYKNSNLNLMENNQSSLNNTKRQNHRNININLNFNIIEGKSKPNLRQVIERTDRF